jgi:hypothetical protein
LEHHWRHLPEQRPVIQLNTGSQAVFVTDFFEG